MIESRNLHHNTSAWSVIRVVLLIHALATTWLLAILPAITGSMGTHAHGAFSNIGFCLISLVLIVGAFFANHHGDYIRFAWFLAVSEIVAIWF